MADLPGRQGVRGFLKHLKGGGIIADTAGPLQMILAIGGTRAALATLECARYPYHVVTSADDIGAVGCSGETVAEKTAFLEGLREMTHEALVADSLLYHAQQERRRLPLYFARAETDGSHSASELARGRAIENVMVCAKNAMSAARNLGKHVGWDTAWDTYLELSKQMPQDKSVQFPEFREEMIDGWRLKKGTFFAPGGAQLPGVYMLPDRFRNIF
jgi:hypothetical protein